MAHLVLSRSKCCTTWWCLSATNARASDCIRGAVPELLAAHVAHVASKCGARARLLVFEGANEPLWSGRKFWFAFQGRAKLQSVVSGSGLSLVVAVCPVMGSGWCPETDPPVPVAVELQGTRVTVRGATLVIGRLASFHCEAPASVRKLTSLLILEDRITFRRR